MMSQASSATVAKGQVYDGEIMGPLSESWDQKLKADISMEPPMKYGIINGKPLSLMSTNVLWLPGMHMILDN